MKATRALVGHSGFGHSSFIRHSGFGFRTSHDLVPQLHQLAGRAPRGGAGRAVAAGPVLPQAPPTRAGRAVDAAVAQGHPGPAGQRAFPEAPAEPAASAPDAPVVAPDARPRPA